MAGGLGATLSAGEEGKRSEGEYDGGGGFWDDAVLEVVELPDVGN